MQRYNFFLKKIKETVKNFPTYADLVIWFSTQITQMLRIFTDFLFNLSVGICSICVIRVLKKILFIL